jgi:hypothetical protein
MAGSSQEKHMNEERKIKHTLKIGSCEKRTQKKKILKFQISFQTPERPNKSPKSFLFVFILTKNFHVNGIIPRKDNLYKENTHTGIVIDIYIYI